MTLSGWTRLWIVGSVIWWAAGAWWLTENHQPNYELVVASDGAGNTFIDPEARARKLKSERELAAILAETVPDPQATDDPMERAFREAIVAGHNQRKALAEAAVGPFTEADYLRVSKADWSDWTDKLYFVVLAPFVGGLVLFGVGLVVRWVWRGFRAPPSTVGQ